MIKFTATRDGRTLVGLGLSEKNIKRLKMGHPVHVFGEEIGLKNVDLVVFYGKTEKDMQRDLSEFIGPNTIWHSP